MTTQDIVVNKAKTLLDMPYKDLGRGMRGVDCVGWFKLILNDIGYEFNPPNDYARSGTVPEKLMREMNLWFDKVPNRKEFRHGDIGVFIVKYHPVHIALFEVDEEGVVWILHACRRRQRTLRERLGEYMTRQHFATFRLREN